MDTAWLVGKCEIRLSLDVEGYTFGYSNYDKDAQYKERIYRNIYSAQNSFGIDMPRHFDNPNDAVAFMNSVLESIFKDYGVRYQKGNSNTIRKELYKRLYS